MIGFPLLLIPFAIYNMIAFLTPGVSWTAPIYSVPLEIRGRLDGNGRRRVPRLCAADADVRVHQVDTPRQILRRAFPGAAARRRRRGRILDGARSRQFHLPAVRRDLLRRPVRGLCGFAAPRAARGRRCGAVRSNFGAPSRHASRRSRPSPSGSSRRGPIRSPRRRPCRAPSRSSRSSPCKSPSYTLRSQNRFHPGSSPAGFAGPAFRLTSASRHVRPP